MRNEAIESNKIKHDRELEEALKSIHEKYGSDFQAYLHDVQELIRKRHVRRETLAF